MSNEKMQQTLQEYLSYNYPSEALRGFVTGVERLNIWLELFLLGPIAGAFGTRSYYLGLTDKRIILVALSQWNNQPTNHISEILLGRITAMEWKQGWLNGKLLIHYGEDIKRRFVIYRSQRENAKKLADVFEFLPKPILAEEERSIAAASERAYRVEAQERMARAVVALIILVVIVFFLNFGLG